MTQIAYERFKSKPLYFQETNVLTSIREYDEVVSIYQHWKATEKKVPKCLSHKGEQTQFIISFRSTSLISLIATKDRKFP